MSKCIRYDRTAHFSTSDIGRGGLAGARDGMENLRAESKTRRILRESVERTDYRTPYIKIDAEPAGTGVSINWDVIE